MNISQKSDELFSARAMLQPIHLDRFFIDQKSKQAFNVDGLFWLVGYFKPGVERELDSDSNLSLGVLFSLKMCRIIYVYIGWLKKGVHFRQIMK